MLSVLLGLAGLCLCALSVTATLVRRKAAASSPAPLARRSSDSGADPQSDAGEPDDPAGDVKLWTSLDDTQLDRLLRESSP